MSLPFTIIEAEQRSPEWFAARAGRLTGSRAADIVKKGRKAGEESFARRDYRNQLVSERIDPKHSQEPAFITHEIRRGIELEPLAFGAYEANTGSVVRKTGFLSCDQIEAGCSLDGDINKFSGIIELKCPKMATHLEYRADPKSFVKEYSAQVAHNLWITGAAFCDLISFDDRFPEPLQFLRVRVERYDAGIPEYEAEALKFLDEVKVFYHQLMDGVYV